jgi:hypothetical protein
MFKPMPLNFDSLYVLSFSQKLNISIVMEGIGHSVDIEGPKYRYRMRANRPAALGFGLDYKWLGFELKIPAFWRQPQPEKGDSRTFGINLNITGRKHSVVSFAKIYNTFYQENILEHDPNYLHNHKGFYPQRTDLTTQNFYSRWLYAFNGDRYSMRAALRQSEKQRKSSGSFMAGAVLTYLSMRADSALVADSMERFFPIIKDVRSYRLVTPGILVGYGFTLKLGRNLFFGGKLILGVNREFGAYRSETGSRINGTRKIGTSSEVNMGLGYNGTRWFWELSITGYNLRNPFDQVNRLSTGFTAARVHLGYRFDATSGKFLKKLGL